MTRREKAIELGHTIGVANRDNLPGIETLRLLVNQWQKAYVSYKRPYEISHGLCVACARHRSCDSCEGCPFAEVGGDFYCKTLALGASSHFVYILLDGLTIDYASSRTMRRIRNDIVAFLKAAVEAAESKETEDDKA